MNIYIYTKQIKMNIYIYIIYIYIHSFDLFSFCYLFQGKYLFSTIIYIQICSVTASATCQGSSVHTRLLFMQLGGEGLHALQVAGQILCLRRHLGWSMRAAQGNVIFSRSWKCWVHLLAGTWGPEATHDTRITLPTEMWSNQESKIEISRRNWNPLQLVKPADDILENCTGTPVAAPQPFRSYHILM